MHRPDVSQRVSCPSCSTPAGGRASCRRTAGSRSRRLGADGSDHQALRRRHPPPSPPATTCRWSTSPRASARTTSPHAVPGRLHRRPRGCCSSGRAQEKTAVFRTEKRRNPITGATYPWIVPPPRWSTTSTSTALMTTSARSSSSSAPTSPTTPGCASTATSTPSARPPRPGSGSRRWTTGSPPVDDPADRSAADLRRLDRGQDRRAAAQVAGPAAAPVHPPPTGPPATATTLSILQAEFSLTQVLDPPGVRADLLRRGHPRQPRPRPPGPGRADLRPPHPHRGHAHPGPVPHPGDHRGRHPEPARRLQAHQDQAVPQGRTSTAHRDHHQRHLRLRHRQTAEQPSRAAGDRLLRQPTSPRRPTTQPRPRRRRHRSRGDHRPVITDTGQRVAGLRFTDPRVQALLATLCMFRLLPRGFTNRDLRAHLASPARPPPAATRSGQPTYDLRRLRHHGLIERIPHITATESPPTASARHSSSPESTTGCSATGSPNSPTPTQPDRRSTQPAGPTKPPSTTYSAAPHSPPEPEPELDSSATTDTTQDI